MYSYLRDLNMENAHIPSSYKMFVVYVMCMPIFCENSQAESKKSPRRGGGNLAGGGIAMVARAGGAGYMAVFRLPCRLLLRMPRQ